MKLVPFDETAQYVDAMRATRPLLNPILGPVYGIIGHDALDDSGIVGKISLLVSQPLDKVFDLITPSSHLEVKRRNLTIVPAGGKGDEWGAAIGGGIGEYIERYYASLAFFEDLKRGRIVYASPQELRARGMEVLGPERLLLFASEQYKDKDFPFARFTEESWIGWVKAHYLLSGKEIYIPSFLVYMAYRAHSQESIIGYPTSGGLSFRPTRDEAIFHGILELVERDAVNLFWISRIPAIRLSLEAITCSSLSPFLGDTAALYVLLLQTDMAPFVVHCSFFNERRPIFLGGGSADFNLREAIRKALLELKQTAYSAQFTTHRVRDKRELMDFFLVIPYYSEPRRMKGLRKQMMRLIAEVQPFHLVEREIPPPSTPKELARVLNLDPIVYEFDLAALGWSLPGSLVRVVLPELTLPGVPLWPFLGHPRYYHSSYLWGITAQPLTYGQLNREPLPFP